MNVHVRTYRRRAANRRRDEGLVPTLARWLAPVAATALLVPLAQPVFFKWLTGSPKGWASGLEGYLLRAGCFIVAWMALDLYAALIRSGDREVLALHPVDPAEVVTAEALAVAAERWWLAPAATALLIPVGMAGHWAAVGLAAALLLGAQILGIAASAMVHLLAIEAAESPAWEGVLDFVRGTNPREQAAFIYAPGVVLGGSALVVSQGAHAAAQLAFADGPSSLALWLVLPAVLAAGCWMMVPGLAQRSWFTASGVLADIDARYGALADHEEGRRVYLDWAVRFLPTGWGVWALKDLRHGWRHRRTWLTGAWFAGVAAAMAGWSGAELAPASAGFIALASAWLVGAVGVLLEADEPDFLRAWLPDGGLARRGARWLVLTAWMQATIWPAVAVLLLRHGRDAALTLAFAGLATTAVAATTALICATLRERGLLVYGPLAALAAVLVAGQLAGGL